MYGNTSIWQDIRNEFRNSVISRIIIINVVVFLILNIIHLIIFLSTADKEAGLALVIDIRSWVMLPADTNILLRRPWTLITHMFTHFDIFHILFNMLWLYWFARIIQEFIGSKKILALYVYGGLAGAVLLIIAYNIFPGLSSELPYVKALGASAGVMAIVVGAATLVPDYTVFLPFLGAVRIKYIALFLVIIDLVSIPDFNSGGHIAHLGGMLFGYIFIKQLKVGHDWSKPFNAMIDWITNLFTRNKRTRVVYKTESKQLRKKARTPDLPDDKQERIDALLDKIARSGYDSLSKDEKEFLFKVSKDE